MMAVIHPQGEEYTILHKQDQLWWQAQDKYGYMQNDSIEEMSSLVTLSYPQNEWLETEKGSTVRIMSIEMYINICGLW